MLREQGQYSLDPHNEISRVSSWAPLGIRRGAKTTEDHFVKKIQGIKTASNWLNQQQQTSRMGTNNTHSERLWSVLAE